MNNCVIIAIVLYNKKPLDSKTLLSLANVKLLNVDIVIYNNGPEVLNHDEFSFLTENNGVRNFHLKNTILNMPLSKIYNEVLDSNSFWQRVIFFDDDTVIDNNFAEKVFSSEYDLDLLLPNIAENGTLHYPVVNEVVVEEFSNLKITETEIFSIGSGLTVFRSLYDKFKKHDLKLFDERFALYGVDFNFFRRLKHLSRIESNVKIKVLGVLTHSLSRNDSTFSLTRHYERMIDTVLTAKHYPKYYYTPIYVLLKIIATEIMAFRFGNIVRIVKVYKNGKHPRC